MAGKWRDMLARLHGVSDNEQLVQLAWEDS
jgi:hypothetical protein